MPDLKGLGGVLIEQVFAADYSGQVRVKCEGGFACELTAPDPALISRRD